MRPLRYGWIVASIVVTTIILVAIWMLVIPAMQPVSHSIIFHYTDGTTSELTPFLSITYEGKKLDAIEYQVSGDNIELSSYTPYFHSPLWDHHMEPQNGSNASWVVDIYSIIYYTLDDGIYEVVLVPDGVILDVALPNPIEFKLKVFDDRSIGLEFG